MGHHRLQSTKHCFGFYSIPSWGSYFCCRSLQVSIFPAGLVSEAVHGPKAIGINQNPPPLPAKLKCSTLFSTLIMKQPSLIHRLSITFTLLSHPLSPQHGNFSQSHAKWSSCWNNHICLELICLLRAWQTLSKGNTVCPSPKCIRQGSHRAKTSTDSMAL